jgi:hypothetical protein
MCTVVGRPRCSCGTRRSDTHWDFGQPCKRCAPWSSLYLGERQRQQPLCRVMKVHRQCLASRTGTFCSNFRFNMCDKQLALSLVRAHLLHNPDYLSWVPAYTTIRWARKKAHSVHVGGHYRRKALYARLLSALHVTCKLQELIYPEDATRVCPPPTAFKERWSKSGDIIPIRKRQLEWS